MAFVIVEIDLNAFPTQPYEKDFKEVLAQVYSGVAVTGKTSLTTSQQKNKQVGSAYINALSMRRELEQAREVIKRLEEENLKLQIRSNY